MRRGILVTWDADGLTLIVPPDAKIERDNLWRLLETAARGVKAARL